MTERPLVLAARLGARPGARLGARLGALLGVLLAAPALAQAQVERGFERVQLSERYYAECAAVADVDGDGAADLVSGPFVYLGPALRDKIAFKQPRPQPIGAASDQFFVWPTDLDGDGDLDLLEAAMPGLGAVWYEHPGADQLAAGEPWARHVVFDGVGMEPPRYVDIDGDGVRELLCASEQRLGWLEPAPDAPRARWTFRAVTEQQPMWIPFMHGLGAADLDDDGRLDLLTVFGWLEQPEDPDDLFVPHQALFGAGGGAQMYASDVDGDGDRDVLTSIYGHGYGLSWFENLGAADPAPEPGALSFREHQILPREHDPDAVSFSQLHGLAHADLDGDGLEDLVTGKTFWAHNGRDAGAREPAVLYWFRLVRDDRGARFEPHLIDDDSGIGRQIAVGDLDADGRPDLAIGNKNGLFVFYNRLR